MSLSEGPPPVWADGRRSFLDSNVLVYAEDQRYPEKKARARVLIHELGRTRTAVVSTQVLQEYFDVVVRKLRMPPHLARRRVEAYARMHVVQNDVASVLAAIDLHQLHQLSFWDALILHAAQAGGARCCSARTWTTATPSAACAW